MTFLSFYQKARHPYDRMTEMSSIFEGSSHLETAESDDSKYYVSEFLSSPIALNPAERLRYISPASVVGCERPAATAYAGGKSTTGCRCAASPPAPCAGPIESWKRNRP